MIPNDLLAQFAAQQDALIQQAKWLLWWSALLWLAAASLNAFVIYMFYARLRDISQELMRFRIAYEMAEHRKLPPRPPSAGLPDEI